MADIGVRRFLRAIDPSIVLGAAGTIAFYSVIHQPAMRDTVLYHYTTEHAVEYVVVALFIWGIVDVILKMTAFPREMMALRQEWLPPRGAREPAENAARMLQSIQAKPAKLQRSRIGRRLILALSYVVERGSAEDYREYLQQLAEQDDQATYANYTLLRFGAAVTPVLGLIGTVVHFGTALSGISFDQLSERLSLVVGEMGTAFNTTTIALAAAITMMFSLFVCERIERGIVGAIDRFVDRELLNRFEVKDPNVIPFLSAMRTANDEALHSMTATLQKLIGAWSATLDTLFDRFDRRQQQETLALQNAILSLENRHIAFDEERTEQVRNSLTLLDSKQDHQLGQISAILERVASLREDCGDLVENLRRIARGEGKLAELQAILNDNLRTIHQTQQLDDALHGLTAAIHLLTSRHRGIGPYDSAAA